MAKKKKAEKTERVYTLFTGASYRVIGEDGKFLLCEGGVQFRKSAGRGVLTERAAVPEEEEREEEN